MAKELSKEELLEAFEEMWCSATIGDSWKLNKGARQAYQQIRELIEGAKETVFISDEYLEKLKEKPKVSKEFVEKWAEKMTPDIWNNTKRERAIYREAVSLQGGLLLIMLQEAGVEVVDCLHKHTICINEEGHTGVFCADCGEQLEKEC